MSLAKLAEALAKAQGQMKGASKDTTNPFFKSKYADLASVWDACRIALSDNGLSIVQPTMITDKGDIAVKTILLHSSGEFLEGILPIQVGETANAQQVGSAITYARRYALASMVGVSPEDDDGQIAVGSPKTKVKDNTALKDRATAFAKQLDDCTSLPQLNELVEKENKIMAELKVSLPDWFDRLGTKISQSQEAFQLAEAAE